MILQIGFIMINDQTTGGKEIEKHAFETYVKYSAYHPEDTKIAEIAQDEYEHSKELQKAMMMVA